MSESGWAASLKYTLDFKHPGHKKHVDDLINNFFFLVVLGLHCYARAFSSCGERGLLFVVVCGILIAVASLVAEHGL